MSEMRLMEKLRAHKFTDFTYVWDTTYTGILVRSADGDFPANIRTTATEAFTHSSADPTWDSTAFNYILPRRYQYTTVFDGVARGNIKVKSDIEASALNAASVSYYIRCKVHLKSITEAGVSTTLASTAYTTTIVHTCPGSSTSSLTVDIPFWLDLDNIILPNDERLILNIVIEGGKYVRTSYVSGSHSAVGTYYHTVNTDECFIELPIIP